MHKTKPNQKSRTGYRIWQLLIVFMIALGLLSFLGVSSADNLREPIQTSAVPEWNFTEFIETDAKVMQATISGPGVQNVTLDYVMVQDLPMFEGDIVLNLDSIALSGVAVNKQSYLWEDGLVVYEIDPKLTNQERVLDAIEHWEANTPIRFVERTPETASQYPNYVYFKPSFGCWSYVGMVGGRQDLGLAPACSTGNTVHEIGHAVGLWHEQSRADRDQYVTIHYENISSAYVHNFNQHISDGVDLGEYDYGSIMHYPRWAFSKNGKDTIVPHGDHEIGQRDSLSENDIASVLELYEFVPAR